MLITVMKHINRNKSYLLVTVVLIAQTVLTTLSAQIKGDSLVNVAFSKAESRDLQGGIASYTYRICWRKITLQVVLMDYRASWQA